MNNNGFIKGMLFAMLAIYVISPLDLAPGPVDDLLMIILNYIINTRQNNTKALPAEHSEDQVQEV